MKSILDELSRSVSTSLFPPATLEQIEFLPWVLPAQHKELLLLSNGLSVFHGYRRLFAANDGTERNLLSWNIQNLWKFAWNTDLSNYLCFGESGWGDQYAYRLDELLGTVTPKVYRLEYIDMSARIWNESFDEFINRELLRWTFDPYDPDSIAAYEKLGDLEWNEQAAYAPPVVIGGAEDVNNAIKMPAVTNMVYNGDLFHQICNVQDERAILGLEPFTDSAGRARMLLKLGPVI